MANGTEPDLEEYFAIGGVKLVVADDFDEVAQGEVFQVLMGGREEEYPAILNDVTHAKIAAWWDRAVDIIPANGGKGVAVEKVLEFYGIDKADSMAFGDGNNDIVSVFRKNTHPKNIPVLSYQPHAADGQIPVCKQWRWIVFSKRRQKCKLMDSGER